MSQLNQLIQLAAQSVRFGQLTMNLDVHDGHVRSIEGNEQAQRIYPNDGVQKAVEEQLAILAQLRTQGTTGKITFTYDLKSGLTKKMYIHRQIKHLLTGE